MRGSLCCFEVGASGLEKKLPLETGLHIPQLRSEDYSVQSLPPSLTGYLHCSELVLDLMR